MSIESQTDLEGLVAAGRVVAEALESLAPRVRSGISTAELDAMAAEIFARRGARSAPNLVYGFPGAICISVNDEAVHGVPSSRRVLPGDLVTLDVTVELDGYYADAAVTVPVAPVSAQSDALRHAAEAAFWKAVEVARAGELLREIGRIVDLEVGRRGFRVLPELSGHGIGRTIHEAPDVLNFEDPRDETRLTDGLVITIEPIIGAGHDEVITRQNGWTVASKDRSRTAHYEHTIVVGRGSARIVTL